MMMAAWNWKRENDVPQRKEEKRQGMHYANRMIPLGKVSSWPNHRLHTAFDLLTLWSKKNTAKIAI